MRRAPPCRTPRLHISRAFARRDRLVKKREAELRTEYAERIAAAEGAAATAEAQYAALRLSVREAGLAASGLGAGEDVSTDEASRPATASGSEGGGLSSSSGGYTREQLEEARAGVAAAAREQIDSMRDIHVAMEAELEATRAEVQRLEIELGARTAEAASAETAARERHDALAAELASEREASASRRQQHAAALEQSATRVSALEKATAEHRGRSRSGGRGTGRKAAARPRAS